MEFKDNTLFFSESDRALCKGLPEEAPSADIDTYRRRVQAQHEAVQAVINEARMSPIRGDRGAAEGLGHRLTELNVLGAELAAAAHHVPLDATEVELQSIVFRG